jgi:predicted amidohydrolase YtcJ
MRTLYRAGRIYRPGHPLATALVVEAGTIVWTGPAQDVPGDVDRTVDLGDTLLAPGFVDAHLHVTETGLLLDGLDLRSARSVTEILDAVADAARRHLDQPVLGHGWDETLLEENRPPTRAELDSAAPGRRVYLSRIDVHSAVISTALADSSGAALAEGWSSDGRVERAAHATARDAARTLTGARRRAAQRQALTHAAARGVVAVHEMSAPHIVGDDDPHDLLAVTTDAAGEDPVASGPVAGCGRALPAVTIYRAELVQTPHDARQAADNLGVPVAGLAGDLCVDGSIGSRTAAFTDAYADAPGHHGHLALSAEQIRDHVAACTRAGLQAGFHAIGDEAVDAVRRGFRRAAEQVGIAAVRAARHRLEHLEAIDAEGVADLADLGVAVSVQPAFDAMWGGPHGMYATRLGTTRALALNPLAALAGSTITLALGSDSPVTPIDPWSAIRACTHHHVPEHRITTAVAFDAHTRGGWRLIGADSAGRLDPGSPATFAAWWMPQGSDAHGLPDLTTATSLPECVLTVASGRILHSLL